jgi:hypothetical protein
MAPALRGRWFLKEQIMRMTPLAAKLAALGGSLALGTAALAADGTFSLGTGFNYSSGKYGGTTATDITSIPLLAKYETDAWTWKLTVPYLYVSGATGVIPGIGKPGGGSTTTGTEQGLGDTTVAGTYAAYYDNANKFGVDLTGKVKLATGSRDKGLGTGANDYTAMVELFKVLGRTTLFGGLGYTVMGSTDTFKPNNVYSFSVGGSYKLNDQSSVGLSYDGRERVTASASPVSEVTGFVSHKLNKRWKSQFYLLKGLDYGSPDWGAGASVNYAF